MTSAIHEKYVELISGEINIRTGFRITPGELLAGGPIELEFLLENLAEKPFDLDLAGDRMRQRPGQLIFDARFEGELIDDPMKGTTWLGGPSTVVKVQYGKPWRQPILLNQFVRLEQIPKKISSNLAKGQMSLVCERLIPLSPEHQKPITIQLSFTLYRNDQALDLLTTNLYNEIINGPVTGREHALSLLLSLRSMASQQIKLLANHPEITISNRAKNSLAIFD